MQSVFPTHICLHIQHTSTTTSSKQRHMREDISTTAYERESPHQIRNSKPHLCFANAIATAEVLRNFSEAFSTENIPTKTAMVPPVFDIKGRTAAAVMTSLPLRIRYPVISRNGLCHKLVLGWLRHDAKSNFFEVESPTAHARITCIVN